MRIRFKKMNGAGNDFVMIDDLEDEHTLSPEEIAFICDRRRGVGGDGLIKIMAAEKYDFHMSYYNSDGLPAEMCGNGARCAAHFAAALGLGHRNGDSVSVSFSTDSGPIDARISGETVSISMMDANEMRQDIAVRVAEMAEKIHFIIAGTRHALVLVDDAKQLTHEEIMRLGKQVRNESVFAPIGANVNFVSVDDNNNIHLRTYEKGIEAETFACGTGSVAASVLLGHLGRVKSPATVVQSGGEEFTVTFELRPYGATSVVLEGPVAVNFEGTLSI